MGYESRLYVVDKSDHKITVDEKIEGQVQEREYVLGELLTTFNLCSLGGECYRLWDRNCTDCTFLDGNEFVTVDKYGKHLTETPLKEAIEILEKAERKQHYRRLLPVIAYLRFIDESEWDNVVVLHYGY